MQKTTVLCGGPAFRNAARVGIRRNPGFSSDTAAHRRVFARFRSKKAKSPVIENKCSSQVLKSLLVTPQEAVHVYWESPGRALFLEHLASVLRRMHLSKPGGDLRENGLLVQGVRGTGKSMVMKGAEVAVERWTVKLMKADPSARVTLPIYLPGIMTARVGDASDPFKHPPLSVAIMKELNDGRLTDHDFPVPLHLVVVEQLREAIIGMLGKTDRTGLKNQLANALDDLKIMGMRPASQDVSTGEHMELKWAGWNSSTYEVDNLECLGNWLAVHNLGVVLILDEFQELYRMKGTPEVLHRVADVHSMVISLINKVSFFPVTGIFGGSSPWTKFILARKGKAADESFTALPEARSVVHPHRLCTTTLGHVTTAEEFAWFLQHAVSPVTEPMLETARHVKGNKWDNVVSFGHMEMTANDVFALTRGLPRNFWLLEKLSTATAKAFVSSAGGNSIQQVEADAKVLHDLVLSCTLWHLSSSGANLNAKSIFNLSALAGEKGVETAVLRKYLQHQNARAAEDIVDGSISCDLLSIRRLGEIADAGLIETDVANDCRTVQIPGPLFVYESLLRLDASSGNAHPQLLSWMVAPNSATGGPIGETLVAAALCARDSEGVGLLPGVLKGAPGQKKAKDALEKAVAALEAIPLHGGGYHIDAKNGLELVKAFNKNEVQQQLAAWKLDELDTQHFGPGEIVKPANNKGMDLLAVWPRHKVFLAVQVKTGQKNIGPQDSKNTMGKLDKGLMDAHNELAGGTDQMWTLVKVLATTRPISDTAKAAWEAGEGGMEKLPNPCLNVVLDRKALWPLWPDEAVQLATVLPCHFEPAQSQKLRGDSLSSAAAQLRGLLKSSALAGWHELEAKVKRAEEERQKKEVEVAAMVELFNELDLGHILSKVAPLVEAGITVQMVDKAVDDVSENGSMLTSVLKMGEGHLRQADLVSAFLTRTKANADYPKPE